MKIYPLFLPSLLCMLSCKNDIQEEAAFTAFSGARIIDGSGSSPIEDGIPLVQEDQIYSHRGPGKK